MIKRNIKVTKDYFSLVNFKNKYLIIFIIVDFINVLTGLFIPYFASMIIENVTKRSFGKSFYLVIFLGFIYLFNKIGSYCTNWCYANFFKDSYVEVHKKLVDSIYNFDEEFYKKLPIGKILNSSNMDIINVAEIPALIFELFIELIKLAFIYFILVKKNIIIAFYIFLIDLIYYRYASRWNDKSSYYFKKQKNYADKITSLLTEVLEGLKDVKVFDLGSKLNHKFDSYRKKWQQSYFLKRKYYFTRKTLINLIIDLGKIFLYCLLIFSYMKTNISLSVFILVISYYDKAKESINSILNFDISIKEEAVSLYRIKDILMYGKNTLKLCGDLYRDQIIGLVEFKNVSFKYDKGKVLKSVSFKALPHQITAIVGKTGSGKSTIFNLLLRIYKVDSGRIFIDNQDIYKYSKDGYKANISVVNQKTFLFNMSIRENLSLVDDNKNRQIEVCKKIGIHDFIMSLPEGYNTILKSDATNFSGGQKQLLSLARTLLSTSEIILLDEITSSLDPNTTDKIIKLLQDLKKDYTVIVITHDKEIMKIADKLIVLSDGRVKCSGKHENLIRKDKVYQELLK